MVYIKIAVFGIKGIPELPTGIVALMNLEKVKGQSLLILPQ
jgi:hypothetical protein